MKFVKFSSRSSLVSLLILFLLTGWAVALVLLFEDHAPLPLVLAVIFPGLLAGSIIYLQHGMLPSRHIREISVLAQNVEKNLGEGLEHISPSKEIPIEIMPLINSINLLLAYFKDRYNQERDFTANASHELRTPLAGIRLQAEIAQRTKSPEQLENSLKNILKAVDRSTQLVEQLLTLSRLTADKVNQNTVRVNLNELAAHCLAELRDLASSKYITLVLYESEPIYYIQAMEESLSILMSNLVRNSITHCPNGSCVDLRIISTSVGVNLEVNDNGPGISEEKRIHVLGRFQKAEHGSKTGTGLGLAIVKRIADMHSASVLLTTGNNERGLKVTVTFPAG